MATFAALTAAEIAAAALDKPMMVAVHALESPQIARWDADGSLAAGDDISATGYPARFSYDRRTGKPTKPNAGATTQYLAYQLNASPADFDCIFIVGHNFGTIGGLTVSVEIADNSAFSTNLREIASWSPGSSNVRLSDLTLNHSGSGISGAARYSAVDYLRLKTTGGSHTPEVGELWVGRRRQLLHKGNIPYDDLGLRSSQRVTVNGVGEAVSSAQYVGQHVVAARLNPHDSTAKSDIQAWFRECNYGTRSFVWVEDPATYPARFHVVKLDEPSFAFPLMGPFEREITVTATEQGPHFLDPEIN